MDGLTGLSKLQSLQNDTPEAAAEDIHGGPADSFHSHRGETAAPYSWESQATPAGSHGPYTPEEGLVDDDDSYFILGAGTLDQDPTSERAPWTHAAPWPKNPMGDGSIGPDNTSRQLIQNAEIHASVVGGKRNVQVPTMDPVNDHWSEIWQVDPNSSDLERPGPQLRSGMASAGRGGTDRTQSNAVQNEYGFDSRHMHRRIATGSIPGNYMWMKPGGRPMVKSLAGPARPAIGPDSPFAGQDLGMAYGIDGAILQSPAQEYTGPPTPYVAPAPDYSQDEAPNYAEYYGSY
jgi:hypothetical protein